MEEERKWKKEKRRGSRTDAKSSSSWKSYELNCSFASTTKTRKTVVTMYHLHTAEITIFLTFFQRSQSGEKEKKPIEKEIHSVENH